MLGDGLSVAAGAGHDLDIGLPAVAKVDMIRPHSVTDDAFSFSVAPSVVQVPFSSHIRIPSMEKKTMELKDNISQVRRLPQRLSCEPTNRTDSNASVPDPCSNVIVAWDSVLVQKHLVGLGAAVELLPWHVYGL